MIKRLLAQLICFTLAWTSVFPAYAAIPVSAPEDVETLSQRYPNARVIHVSPEAYPALRQALVSRGYMQSGTALPVEVLAQAEAVPDERVEKEDECKDWEERVDALDREEARALIEKCRKPDQEIQTYDPELEEVEGNGASEDSFRIALDFTEDLLKGNNDNDEMAAVVFIVIGAVVLVVWTLYAVRYLIKGQSAPAGRWSELVTSSSFIASNDSQHARFTGLRYMRGFKDGGTYVGISAELGDSDILLTEVGSLRLRGLYWFLGPMLRWNLGESEAPNYFQMEFVAGSTVHPEMGIIAQAKMGLSFAASEHLRWGINMGAMNINLHANQGFITDLHQFYLLFGLEFGYRF